VSRYTRSSYRSPKTSKKSPNENPENISGGDDDVLEKLMQHLAEQSLSKEGVMHRLSQRGVHSVGFLLELDCTRTVHELCTNELFSAYGVSF